MKIIRALEGYTFKKGDLILSDTLYLGIDDLEQNYQQIKKPIKEDLIQEE